MARERSDEVLFFGVAWKASAAECQSFIDHFDVPYDNALDASEKVFRSYGIPYQPVTVLIDGDGRIFDRISGPVGGEFLEERIDALLAA